MEHRVAGMRRGLVLVSLISLIAAACGTSTPSAAPSAEASQPAASAAPSEVAITPAPINADAPGPNGGKVIRWFIGLGTGGKPDQIAAETKVADDFNNSQKDVYLSVEIYDNRVASNQLQIEIAAGNAPDIIGPVGVEGLNIFRSQILDLSDLVTSQNFDMSNIDPKLVEFWKMGENDAMIGLPFATYPSFMYYNKNLFDEADLPYPPTKVGEQYQGKTWDMEAVRQLGMKLTVDKNGNDATSSDFDANSIVQWGFDSQWADNNPVAESTIFGAFSVVGDDGKTAQIPDPLKTGLEWYSNGVWKDHFIPTYAQIRSDLLGPDNEFSTGNLAMAETHSWYMCCINPAPPARARLRVGRRGRAVIQRHDDGEAPCGHLQPAQVDEAPGRGLQGPDRAGQFRCTAGELRGFPGRSVQAGRVLRHDQQAVSRRHDRLGRAAGDAVVSGHPQPSVVHARLRQGQEGPPGPWQRVSDERARHRCRADEAANGVAGHLRRGSGIDSLLLRPPGRFSSAREVELSQIPTPQGA